MSTPSTPKGFVLKLARKLPPPPPDPPPPDPPPPPPKPPVPPPEVLMAGIVPLRVRSFRVSPPAAADTSCRSATVVTEDELIEPSVPPAARGLGSILVPAAGRLGVPVRNPKPNEPGVFDP